VHDVVLPQALSPSRVRVDRRTGEHHIRKRCEWRPGQHRDEMHGAGAPSVDQTFALAALAPASSSTASTFTVTLPGGTTLLAATQLGVFPVHRYFDLYTKFATEGGTIVPGTFAADGVSTWDNGSGPMELHPSVPELTGTSMKFGTEGPLTSNGHDITFDDAKRVVRRAARPGCSRGQDHRS
jgi:hypothetical protein